MPNLRSASASMLATLTSPQAHVSALQTTANYFVTLCTHERQCLFGDIVDGEMQLNEVGEIVASEWHSAAQDRADLDCDQWIIMPNHIHGIVAIADHAEACPQASTDSPKNEQRTLSDWMNEFKAKVTARLQAQGSTPYAQVWQPTNDQQLIPHHFALNIFQQYMRSNAHSWPWDKLHPDSPSDWLYPEGSV